MQSLRAVAHTLDAGGGHDVTIVTKMNLDRVGSNYSAEPQHAIMVGFADEW